MPHPAAVQKTLREEIQFAQNTLAWNQIVLMVLISQWLSYSIQADKYAAQSCLKQSLHQSMAASGAGILAMMRQAARAEIQGIKTLEKQQ